MTTLTASEARSSLYRLIDETATSHQPVVITGKRHNADGAAPAQFIRNATAAWL